MRKFLSYALLIAFTLPVLQAGIKVHYCGNELTGIDFFNGLIHTEDCDCAEEGEESCCTDLVIQAPDATNLVHQKVNQSTHPRQFSIIFYPLVRTETSFAFAGQKDLNQLGKHCLAPPQQTDLAFISVFRI